MKPYLTLLSEILEHGDKRVDRTQVGTLALFGKTLSFDLQEGFPAVTTKRLYFNSVAAELAGFLEATQSAKRMRELGTKIWDANAASYHDKGHSPDPDYLGPIYGCQWRAWNNQIDQLETIVELLQKDPTSRRMLVTAWNPSENDKMCLPSCHTHFQFFVRGGTYLDCIFYMRSVDSFLGMPFDIASYALLMSIVAQQTGFLPGVLTGMFADCHIYLNHIEQVKLQIERPPLSAPKLLLHPQATINNFTPDMATLEDYKHWPPIKGEMAL